MGSKYDELKAIWWGLNTQVHKVYDEQGANTAGGEIREMDDGTGRWLYVDDQDGFEIIDQAEAERLLLNGPADTRIQGRYFSLNDAKLVEVCNRSGMSPERVTALALDYDWTNADEHQAWLDSAGEEEIAAWLHSIA